MQTDRLQDLINKMQRGRLVSMHGARMTTEMRGNIFLHNSKLKLIIAPSNRGNS